MKLETKNEVVIIVNKNNDEEEDIDILIDEAIERIRDIQQALKINEYSSKKVFLDKFRIEIKFNIKEIK